MGALERFWKWTLSVEPAADEDFSEYLARYRREMKEGFVILDRDPEDTKAIQFPVLDLRAKSRVSVDEEMARLRIYFQWLDDKRINLALNRETINWNHERRRREVSKHADYISGKINGYALERIAKKETHTAKGIKRYTQVEKAFPFRFFPLLIDTTPNVREKLLYLLMGGTSARISQALNLTLEDIDYDRYDVYLSDPAIDDPSQKGLLGETRKRWLRENYGIDVERDHPHNQVLFKYPIPYPANRPLYWLNESLQNQFFTLLADYTIYPVHQRRPKHPFFFTKLDGGRLLYRPALEKFKRDCRLLYQRIQSDFAVQPQEMSDREYREILSESELLLDLTPHSLRHMYGNYMAELFYRASLKKIPVEAERIRIYCQHGMGHGSTESTDVYFNARMERVIMAGEEYFVHYLRDHKYLPVSLFIKGLT